jgi:hypothetical protein
MFFHQNIPEEPKKRHQQALDLFRMPLHVGEGCEQRLA